MCRNTLHAASRRVETKCPARISAPGRDWKGLVDGQVSSSVVITLRHLKSNPFFPSRSAPGDGCELALW